MKCPECHHDNLPDALFCENCGAGLSSACPHCRAANSPAARFCRKCGKPLSGRNGEGLPASPERFGAAEAERRQLTVLFCDMVGSTALSERLDLEDFRELIRQYQSVCEKVVHRYEGSIAQYLGDGILVYFGYPHAHEDDAHRAVRSGLSILEGIRNLNARLQKEGPSRAGINLAVRIGIHTGLVVVGEIGQRQNKAQLAFGEVPNLAARLQELADPDTLVISEATYRLSRGFFESWPLGRQVIKGLSQPVEIFRVLRESGARSRLEAAKGQGLSPLVGREQEVDLLMERWSKAKNGTGYGVLLSGEAGIGKSRLADTVKERVANDPQAWLTECICSAYHRNSAFFPIIESLEQVVLGFEADDPPEKKISKLEGFLIEYGFSLQKTVRPFANLMSIPMPEASPAHPEPPPAVQKQIIMDTLLEALAKKATQQPVLFVVEDLHWADPSTLEWLDLLIRQIPNYPILALFTARPQFTAPWPNRANTIQLTLDRLSAEKVETLCRHLTKGKMLPAAIIQKLIHKTDGVPLFVEELTHMVLESGLLIEKEAEYQLPGALPELAIPSTLQDSLMARLDRLSFVKEAAQVGAVLGREFSFEMMQAVTGWDAKTLDQHLSKLVDAELLYQRHDPPQAIYNFKHALIQEASYQSLVKSRRRQIHQKVAAIMENRFPALANAHPELLAYHYTEAGLSETAVEYWLRAGRLARHQSANLEAVSHCRQGLTCLASLPETTHKAMKELDLLITLGPALANTQGLGNPEVRSTYARTQELCQQLDEQEKLFPVLMGLATYYRANCHVDAALKVGNRMIRIVRQQPNPLFRVIAHDTTGAALFMQGALRAADEHLMQAYDLFEPEQQATLPFDFGVDPGVHCLVYIAPTKWFLGFPDQALDRIREAEAIALRTENAISIEHAWWMYAWICILRGEWAAAKKVTDQLIEHSTQHRNLNFLGYAKTFLSLCLLQAGVVDKGLSAMREGMALLQKSGFKATLTFIEAMLADHLGRPGRTDQGLNRIEKAITLLEETGEAVFEAEQYRVKGTLLWQTGDREAAEHCFQHSLEVARRQEAKSLELRTALSMARLWQQDDKAGEINRLLQETYNWFSEGFDSADLKDAKAFLEETSMAG